jgi:hypothetical protein
MAESYKFGRGGLNDALEVFPELPWTADGDGNVTIYDEKQGVNVPVSKGQYIVKIANRYEVHDEEPEKAKPAEPVADAEE